MSIHRSRPPRAVRRVGLVPLLLTLVVTACDGGPSDPGHGGDELSAAREALLAADRAHASASDAPATSGFTDALAGDVLYLAPAGPVVRGREAVVATLAASSRPYAGITWTPARAEVAADGRFGVTFGAGEERAAGAQAASPFRYVAAWRRAESRWEVIAWFRTPATSALASLAAPCRAGPRISASTAVVPREGAERVLLALALDHGARTLAVGPRAAVMADLAPDGVLIGFPPTGLACGPDEAGAVLAGVGPEPITLVPHTALVSTGGDVGLTIAEGEVAGRGTPRTLAVWRRDERGARLVALAWQEGVRDAVPAAHLQRARLDLLVAAHRVSAAMDANLADGVDASFAAGGALLYPDQPLRQGRAEVVALLRAFPDATTRRLAFRPVRVDVSASGDAGYAYGFGVERVGSGADGSPIKFISFWRRDPGGAWKIEAWFHARGRGEPEYVAPLGCAAPATASSPAFEGDSSSTRLQVMGADMGFASRAREVSVGQAFAEHVADDGAVLGTGSGIVCGREAVRAASIGGPGALVWGPRTGGGAPSGDLGWSAGLYGGSGVSGKYLTLWQQRPGIGWRFLIDGGNPAPAEP